MKLSKRFAAGLLAAAMMLTMAVPAFAEGEQTAPEKKTITPVASSVANGDTFTITKTLTDDSETDLTGLPSEVPVTFTVANNGQPGSSVPEKLPKDGLDALTMSGKVTVADGKATGSVTVDLPEYTYPGTYVYNLTEDKPTIAGVQQNSTAYTMYVYVRNIGSNQTNTLVCDVTLAANGTKVTQIDNTYKAGNLTVKKEVKGDLADLNQSFMFTVTLTSDKEVKSTLTTAPENIKVTGGTWSKGADDKYTAEYTFELKNGDTLTINNIPDGVQYAVAETLDDGSKDTITKNAIKYTMSTDGKESGMIQADNWAASTTITNNAGTTEIETGVILDNAPYMLMAGVVVLGVVVMLSRKRREE